MRWRWHNESAHCSPSTAKAPLNQGRLRRFLHLTAVKRFAGGELSLRLPNGQLPRNITAFASRGESSQAPRRMHRRKEPPGQPTLQACCYRLSAEGLTTYPRIPAYAATTCEGVSSAAAKRARKVLAVRFMNLLPRMNVSVQSSTLILKGGCNANISCLQNAGKVDG